MTSQYCTITLSFCLSLFACSDAETPIANALIDRGPPSPFDRQAIVDGCMLAAACGVSNGFTPDPGLCAEALLHQAAKTFSNSAQQHHALRMMECGETEKTCDGIDRCLRFGVPAEFCSTSTAPSCAGDVIVECVGGLVARERLRAHRRHVRADFRGSALRHRRDLRRQRGAAVLRRSFRCRVQGGRGGAP